MRFDEHSRLQLQIAILEDGLHANVAGGLIDHRVEGSDPAGFGAGEAVRCHLNAAADAQTTELLLGNREIHIRGLQRLKGNDRRTTGEILTEIHLADSESPGERRANCLARNRGGDLSDSSFG